MTRNSLIARLLAAFVMTPSGGCSDPAWQSPVRMTIGPVDGNTTSFVAVGDFGTGELAQYALAEAMAKVCERQGCDFVLGLGDNFYPEGVSSVMDERFQSSFEDPFAGFDIPFYMVLGNHDVEQTESPQAQIAYASDRWKLPGRWYAFHVGPVRFVALDTTLTGENRGERQLKWIDYALSAPDDADWTVAYGHHPLYSNGPHGNAAGPSAEWLRRAVCGSGAVDLYLAGHDHDLQWLAAKPDECRDTEFIVSGAGARPRALDGWANTAHFMQGRTLGFFWFKAAADSLTGRAYDADGVLLFERTLRRPSGEAATGGSNGGVATTPQSPVESP